MIYSLHTDRQISATEFAQLAAAAQWGEPGEFTPERLASHFAAVTFIAQVRAGEALVGYASALCNGLGAVYVDSLLLHPEYDGEMIGGLLLNAVLDRFPGQAVYGMPFVDEQAVFRNQGFKVYRREMIALAHRNDASVGAL